MRRINTLSFVLVMLSVKVVWAAPALDCPSGTKLNASTSKYAPGMRFETCENEAGESSGPAASYYANGVQRTRSEIRDGKTEGWSSFWGEDGKLLSIYYYDHGKKVARRRLGEEALHALRSRPGDPVHPCPDDAVVAGEAPPQGLRQWCERDRGDGGYVPHGARMEWNGAGVPLERKEYRNGTPHGEWIKWTKGQKIRLTPYIDGVHHGIARGWTEAGILISETKYDHGVVRWSNSWDDQGQKTNEVIKDEQGRYISRVSWHSTGKMRSQEAWLEGEPNGMQRDYWPNGQLKQEGEKRAGRDFGVWRRWNDKGQLLERTVDGPNGSRNRETMVVNRYDEPEWVPRTIPRGPVVAARERTPCPEGSSEARQALGISVAKLLTMTVEGTNEADLEASPLGSIKGVIGERIGCTSPDDASKFQGPAAEYDTRGRLIATGSYENGVKDGSWTQWEADGHRHSVAEFEEGSLRRRVIWSGKGGTVYSIRHYKDGKEHGVFATWWPNGSRRVVGHKRAGENHGVWMWYDENGLRYQKGEYSRERKHGDWTDWWPNGNLKREVQYHEGTRHGQATEMGADGLPRERRGYRNGKFHGLSTKWRGGSKESEAHYVDGVLDGPISTWRKGVLLSQGQYERGRRVGIWSYFHRNGSRRGKGSYLWCEKPPRVSYYKLPGSGRNSDASGDGCKQGVWTYWREDGTARGTFRHDEIALQGKSSQPSAALPAVVVPVSPK